MDYSKWAFHDVTPVYLQLYEKLRNSILGSEIHPGEKMPSIRDMAIFLHISANTVAKAYWLLSQQDLILCSNVKGYKVTSDVSYIQQQRQKQARILCCAYIQRILELGYSTEEATLIIGQFFPDSQ